MGFKDFWTLRLAVTPAVLVPRPETELLVERALALRPDATGRVVDLGTGSGAIALALASERPQWQVTATDVSAEALAVARANAANLGLTRVELLRGKLVRAPRRPQRFDLVVSNPPYIGAREPELAPPQLCVASRAARCRRARMRWPACAPSFAPRRTHLEHGGWLLLEHGATQAADVARELVVRGFRHVRSHRDLAGHERMTEAQWAPTSQSHPIKETVMVRFETSLGNFTIELYQKEAPVSRGELPAGTSTTSTSTAPSSTA